MPSNFLDKLQEAMNPSDSAIKAGGIIFGIGLVAFSVALTATNPIVGAMLMNAGMSVGLQVITDCLEGNKSSVKSLATTAAVSAASGAVGGMVSSLAAGMTSNFVVATVAGASASAENATLQLLTTGKVDAKEVIISGAIGFGVGYITSSIKSSPKAQLDKTVSLNKNAVVIEKKEFAFADDVVDLQIDDLWEKGWSERGFAIDEGLGNNMGRTYKVIDKVDNNVATSIKSMDTGAKTYQNSSKMFSKIKSYINTMVSYDGEVFIDSFSMKQVELALPPRQLTQNQLEALNRAKSYAQTVDIDLRVVIVK